MQKEAYQSLPIFHFSEKLKKLHTRKRLVCLVIGNFGTHSLGDEAVLAGTLTELEKVPALKVSVATPSPHELKKFHTVRAVPFSGMQKEIKKSDFVIVAGSGLFQSTNPKPFSTLRQMRLLLLLLWKQRLFKKKIYFFGLGLYNSTNSAIKQLVLLLVKGSPLVTVRDQYTLDMLKKKDMHAQMFKDISYMMDMAPLTKVMQDAYFKRFYKKDKQNIGLAFYKPATKAGIKHLLNEITALVSKNHEKTHYWFYAEYSQPGSMNDEKFGHILHEEIKKKVGKDVDFHFIPTNWSPQLFFSSIKLMDTIISMRLHTSLFSHRTNTPVICVVNNAENLGLLACLTKDVIHLQDLTAKKIQARLH